MGKVIAVGYSCVDCDGILPLRIDRPLFEEWESVERGEHTRDCELLFAGTAVSSQSQYHPSRKQNEMSMSA